MKRLCFFFSLIIIVSACTDIQPELNAEDHFFLRSGGSVMPVFVNGNTESGVFIIYLHGGPGFTSLEAYQSDENPLVQLQKEYALVYWEQRCAGNSQGNCDYDKLSLSQYAGDLEKLILVLKDQYNENIKIFLMGHSWGGSLGIDFLSRGNNQDQIQGWIEVDGGHNVPRISVLEREMINEIGSAQINLGNNVSKWEEYIREINLLDLNDVDDVFELNRFARRSEDLMEQVDSISDPISTFSIGDYFFSPLSPDAMAQNGQRTIDALREELVKLDLSDQTTFISIPSLLIWGKFDFRVPPVFGIEAFGRYGSSEKEILIFDNSGHFPQWNEPDRFFSEVSAFINRYK